MTTISIDTLRPESPILFRDELTPSELTDIQGGTPFSQLKNAFDFGYAAGQAIDDATDGGVSDAIADGFCAIGGLFGKGC